MALTGKPTIVLLQTRQGYVHKSVDGGRNWQALSDLLRPTTITAPGKTKVSGKDSLIQRMSAIHHAVVAAACMAYSSANQVSVARRQQRRRVHLLRRHNARHLRPLHNILDQAQSRSEEVR